MVEVSLILSVIFPALGNIAHPVINCASHTIFLHFYFSCNIPVYKNMVEDLLP